MMRYVWVIVFACVPFSATASFVGDTLVPTKRGSIPIKDVVVGDYVRCCGADHYSQVTHTCTIQHKRTIMLFFNSSSDPLRCSPGQRLYNPERHEWVAAQDLKIGDAVSGAQLNNAKVSCTIDAPLSHKFYDITVVPCHHFLATSNEIKVHNFIPIFIGIGWVFGAGAIEFSGISIGVATLGTIIGCALYKNKKTNDFELQPCTATTLSDQITLPTDAQAPGKPTEKDGFIPKKNWDGKKVKHRRGYGWLDEKGSIWIPTGPNGHGGPHWDVQHPDGSYDNIRPGGKVRGLK